MNPSVPSVPSISRRLFPGLLHRCGSLLAVALCSASLQATPAALATAPVTTHETTLPNGLRVIVKEDHRSPTAVHMVWYRIGSTDEVDGASGVAHVLEHMMFKGTPSVGPGQFSKRVAALGGKENAFTSRDYTGYYQQVPRESLGQVMQLEADRMRHLNVDPKEFAQEIKVVMEERRMRTDDNPHARLFEQTNAAMYQAHPYRRPIIGWMSDLEHMTAKDAKAWYDQWYVPNNAYMVVVGDVKPQEVFALAKKYYGPLQSRALPQRRPQEEPPQHGVRRVNVKAPAELPLILMGYKVPVVRDADKDVDPYALIMLASILDGHEAARLTNTLVRQQQLAVETGVDYDPTARGPGAFYLSASPSQGRTVAELEAALRRELTRIQEEGISAEELKRAKAQAISAQVYRQDSVYGQAMEIGQTEAAGLPWRAVDTMLACLQAVTAEQIQAVAKKYFSDDNLTIGVLDPQPLDAQPRRAAGPSRH
jgi:zinc protease